MIDEATDCPKCGEEMVKRWNKTTAVPFWGCPLYPQCDGTRQINSTPVHPGYPDWARDKN